MTELILSNGECNTHQVPTKLSNRMCHCVSRIQQSAADRNPKSESGEYHDDQTTLIDNQRSSAAHFIHGSVAQEQSSSIRSAIDYFSGT